MRKQFLKIVKNTQFRSVRVLGVQMRFMMEADNLYAVTLTAYFLKQICHRHLNRVHILTFYCTDIVNI